jgi:hypothetical protein
MAYDEPEMIKIRCWILGQSDKAYKVSRLPKSSFTGKVAWVAKSQLDHVSKYPEVDGWQECEMTMPLWLAEKTELV